jgi:uncharacterized protein (DUF58 family)
MKLLKRIYYSLFFGRIFYQVLAAVIFIFVLSYWVPFLFFISQLILIVLFFTALADYILLFSIRVPVTVKRVLPDRLSNGDENNLYWTIENNYWFNIFFFMIDEFPEPWQIRDFRVRGKLNPGAPENFSFILKPTQRGEYFFGDLRIFIQSPFRIIVRRKSIPAKTSVKVFPGFLLLKHLEFNANIVEGGHKASKQIRKTGQSQEFEQIREYVNGDDIRSINWKATGRMGGRLMMNSYADEKSQQIYCIIDKGRAMKMAFNSISLMDYSINAALMMSAVAISRQDKAGIISFGDKTGDFLPASYRSIQMNGIVNTLYNIKTRFLESDFAFLHNLIRTRLTQRSLLILFTNFESLSAMNRQLSYLRSISKRHLLLVVLFENTSLHFLASGEATNIEGLYEKVIAEKFIMEKKLIVKELQRHGILAMLTNPGDLTIHVINKYLEVKARREI